MAVLWNSKKARFVLTALALVLLADQGWCRPGDGEDLEYNNDDPAYDDGVADDDLDYEYTGPPPFFKTHPLNRSASPGESIVLDCDTEGTEPFVVIWLSGSDTLFLDKRKLSTNPRIARLDNNSLQLTELQPEDSGPYTCQIGSNPVLNLTHHLAVTSPALITKVTSLGGSKTLKVGETLSLDCATSGFPEPTVTWSKENTKPPGSKKIGEGRVLKIESVHHGHAGRYQCKASNGIGSPAMQSIDIIVSYAPVVTMDKLVRSGVGEEVDLTCMVHAVPKARVLWQRNAQTITKSDNVIPSNSNGLHTLRIKSLQKDDFGKYVCFAKNFIGEAKEELELSGLPHITHFQKVDSEGDQSVILKWTVVSFAPITEYELQYKNEMLPKWERTHPMVVNPEGNMYSVEQGLPQLVHGEYKAFLRAKNGFGWSESPLEKFVHNNNGAPAAETSIGDNNGAPAAETSIGEPSSSASNLRPWMSALLMVASFRVLFL